MRTYNMYKRNNPNCKGNEGMIRKNVKHMSNEEILYIKRLLGKTRFCCMSFHAEDKGLIKLSEVNEIIKNKRYDIIDFNYHIDKKEERILIRTKNIYEVRNNNGKKVKCYLKIVLSLINNAVITVWANTINNEEEKQDKISNRYYKNFDIINKKIKL